MHAGADVACLHQAVIDTEDQHQRYLGDEQQAEEEGQSAQRLVVAALKRNVVDLIDRHSQQVESRRGDHGDGDRVQPKVSIADIGDVGSQQNERRMRDIDDVQHAEGNRDADGHGGVEPSQQQAGDKRVQQKIEGKIHARYSTGAFIARQQGVQVHPAVSPKGTLLGAHDVTRAFPGVCAERRGVA
jgi:hypothetical protein